MGEEELGKAPKLVRRRENRKSSLKIGRTIAESREKLETKNERTAARKKDKLKKTLRIVFTIIGFIILVLALVGLYLSFRSAEQTLIEINENSAGKPKISVEVIDENSNGDSTINLTNRMTEFISQVISELKTYNYTPVKVVIPSGSIREVDFYLEGYPGFIKTTIDRGAGVTAEDSDRMLRYLAENCITEFSYIDVRIDRKAYYK